MNYYFDFPHFIPVKAKKIKTTPVFIDESLVQKLKLAYNFVRSIKKSNDLDPAFKFYSMFQDFKNKDFNYDSSLSPEELLTELSYLSLPGEESILEDYDSFKNSFNDLTILLGEKFLSGYEMANSGSSRHIILKGLDIKGSGRNLLAHRVDFTHSWGGANLNEAILDLFNGYLLHFSTPLGAERVIALSQTEFRNSFLIFRERSSHRVCNGTVKLMHEDSIKTFKNLVNSFDGPEKYLRAHMIQIFSSILNGFFHGALNIENSLLSGKFIDCQTIILSEKINTLEFSIQIHEKNQSELKSLESLLVGLNKAPDNYLFNHNDLYNLIQYFNALNNSIRLNYEENFCIDLLTLMNKVLENDFSLQRPSIEKLKTLISLNTFIHEFSGKELAINNFQKLCEEDFLIKEYTYQEKSRTHLVRFTLPMDFTNQSKELNKFKNDRHQLIPQKLNKIQKLISAKIKFNLDQKQTSKDLLKVIKGTILPPHFVLDHNNNLLLNQFTGEDAIHFLIVKYRLEKNTLINYINIFDSNYCQCALSELSNLNGIILDSIQNLSSYTVEIEKIFII